MVPPFTLCPGVCGPNYLTLPISPSVFLDPTRCLGFCGVLQEKEAAVPVYVAAAETVNQLGLARDSGGVANLALLCAYRDLLRASGREVRAGSSEPSSVASDEAITAVHVRAIRSLRSVVPEAVAYYSICLSNPASPYHHVPSAGGYAFAAAVPLLPFHPCKRTLPPLAQASTSLFGVLVCCT